MRIVGSNVRGRFNVKGSLIALKMAFKNGIIPRVAEKYESYENAISERINGILKQEFVANLKSKRILVIK